MIPLLGRALALLICLAAGSAPARAADGAALFKARCQICHVDQGRSAMAPPLAGIIGRNIASARGFVYSPALAAKSALKWTPDRLDSFLADPAGFAPGTRMPISLQDQMQRQAIIEYLKSDR